VFLFIFASFLFLESADEVGADELESGSNVVEDNFQWSFAQKLRISAEGGDASLMDTIQQRHGYGFANRKTDVFEKLMVSCFEFEIHA
jgi:hypothetical protein